MATAFQPFQIPQPQQQQTNIGDMYLQMARIKAYRDQQRLEELKFGRAEKEFEREDRWRSFMRDVYEPEQAAPAQGLTPPGAPQPQAAPLPAYQGPSMADMVPPVAPGQGPYGTTGITQTPQAQGMEFQRAPSALQPAGLYAPPAPAQGPQALDQWRQSQGMAAPPPGMAPPAPTLPQAAPTEAAGLRGPAPGQGNRFAHLVRPLNQQALARAYAEDPERTDKFITQHIAREGHQLDSAVKRNDQVYQILKAVDRSKNQPEAWGRALESLEQKGLLSPTFPREFNPAMLQYALQEHRSAEIELKEMQAAHQEAAAIKDMREGQQSWRKDYEKDMGAALYHLYGPELDRTGVVRPEMVEPAKKWLDDQGIRKTVEGYKQTMPDRVRVAQETGANQQMNRPLEGAERNRLSAFQQSESVANALLTEFTPEERARYVGLGGFRMTANKLAQLQADATGGKADPKFARFAALVSLSQAEAFAEAGKALTDTERSVIFGYIPTGGEMSAEDFEAKLALAKERLPAHIEREIQMSTTPRKDLMQKYRSGELTKPLTPQASTVADTFDPADYAAWKQQTGYGGPDTPEVVKQYLRAKGLRGD